MSMKTLESAILMELRNLTGKNTIRKKDIQEWSTGSIAPHDSEVLVRLPKLAINCAVLRCALPKKFLESLEGERKT